MRLAREVAEGKEPAAALQSEQYAVRAIARVSPIGDFNEFMRVHGNEGTVASKTRQESAVAGPVAN
jgi:hypothetical protein